MSTLLVTHPSFVEHDTGPGHLAAAVGTPTVSVLGPTNPRQWGAWGPNVRIVQGDRYTYWPSMQEVLEATQQILGSTTGSSGIAKNDTRTESHDPAL